MKQITIVAAALVLLVLSCKKKEEPKCYQCTRYSDVYYSHYTGSVNGTTDNVGDTTICDLNNVSSYESSYYRVDTTTGTYTDGSGTHPLYIYHRKRVACNI